jgi:pimeloyl-ACP methyl ester carboxylesterase
VLYLAALGGSHSYIAFRHPPGASPDVRFAALTRIQVAYRDSDPAATSMPVILVHGSPGSGDVFRKLTPALSSRFRVIAPDLPGFGESTRELPDYSFRTHARYLVELMDVLHIEKAQLVGFSMGGGVVLSMEDIGPQRVASIVMLSAIGVQEYELTGSYWVNHAIHGTQLAVLGVLHETLPHFGVLDQFALNLPYARNFYDSDQRPLRAVLEKYKGPMLIIHGARDRNVPIAAAREHHRLVPQSELVILDENHFMTFTDPEVFAKPLADFLTQVNDGTGQPGRPCQECARRSP